MGHHPKLDPRLRELLGQFPGWEVWRGVSGTKFYARRRKSSPPLVISAPDVDALAALIQLTSDHGANWRFSYVSPVRIQPPAPKGGFIAKHRHRAGMEYYSDSATGLSQVIACQEGRS